MILAMIHSVKQNSKLVFFIGFVFVLYYISHTDRPRLTPKIFNKNIDYTRVPACYLLPHSDEQVPEISDYTVKPNSIFFFETSCRHGMNVNLTIRQACTYESAARTNPNSEILVLFPSPISMKNLPSHILMLSKFPNMKFLHLNIEKYLEGTPFENMDFMGKINESAYPIVHASDYLRLITLWKYGGTYLDSDFIVLKSLSATSNYASAVSEDSVNNAVLNIDTNSKIGKYVIDEIVKDARDNYRPKIWDEIGPKSVTRVLRRLCKEEITSKMTREKCDGFTVYAPSPTSPFYESESGWNFFFNETSDNKIFDKIKKDFTALHMYGHLSDSTRVTVGSKVPYEALTAEFCSLVHSTIKGDY